MGNNKLINNKKCMNVYIYPTDTVWGIGGSIFFKEVYLEIMRIKKITSPRPVSILFSEVEEIKNFFNLPPQFNMKFLEAFFNLESTLGLSISLIKNNSIPKWLYQSSDIVAIRTLKLKWIKEIIKKENSPIITTSLNLTDFAPILTYNEAVSFKNTHTPSALIVEDPEVLNQKLSGISSSIVYIDHHQNIKTIREGRFYKELKNLLDIQKK
ncbi:MAG: Sua5/YciO/YrdC/YwlC family protein [Oligoflexia bacterium]|nr:Sua5/YciO/YrdC/YwlC family protein [Oligoflexia bacterium]